MQQSINHVVFMLQAVSFFFYLNISDTQRALKLLEEYRSKLNQPEDAQLQHSIDRVISVFQSSLFHALIGKHLHGEIKRNPLLCCDCFLAFCMERDGETGLTLPLHISHTQQLVSAMSTIFPPPAAGICVQHSRWLQGLRLRL